jgi:hypothetical protein
MNATTYTIKHSDWQWLIAPEPKSRKYLLKYRRPTAWTECNSFDTPEAAAEAVAKGTTGQNEWDQMKNERPPSSLAAWLIDPTGGPLAPFIPVVKDILKSTLLPSKDDAVKAK